VFLPGDGTQEKSRRDALRLRSRQAGATRTVLAQQDANTSQMPSGIFLQGIDIFLLSFFLPPRLQGFSEFDLSGREKFQAFPAKCAGST
jgi:hypothetical protein